MNTSRVLHTLSLVSLLALPVAANARTINLHETEDGNQALPENASHVAADNIPLAELATMTISDILNMEINGKPIVVQLHVAKEGGSGNGTDIVVFSSEFPDGVIRPGNTDDPSAVPVPAAAWLLMSGVVGLTAIARRRQQQQQQQNNEAVA